MKKAEQLAIKLLFGDLVKEKISCQRGVHIPPKKKTRLSQEKGNRFAEGGKGGEPTASDGRGTKVEEKERSSKSHVENTNRRKKF